MSEEKKWEKALSYHFLGFVKELKSKVQQQSVPNRVSHSIPSVFSLYSKLLDTSGKESELNVELNYFSFYYDYLLQFLINEKIPTAPMLEIKAIGQRIEKLRNGGVYFDGFAMDIKLLANYILSHQINGPDETEIYVLFNKFMLCDKDYINYEAHSEKTQKCLLKFFKGLQSVNQANKNRSCFIANSLLTLFQKDGYDIRNFTEFVSICTKLGIYKDFQQQITVLLRYLKETKDSKAEDIYLMTKVFLDEKDYQKLLILHKNMPKYAFIIIGLTKELKECPKELQTSILCSDFDSKKFDLLKLEISRYKKDKESIQFSLRAENVEGIASTYPLKKMTESIQYPAQVDMPLGLFMAIIHSGTKKSEKALRAFTSFHERFKKVSQSKEAKGDEQQGTDWVTFMDQNSMKLVNLYELLGADLFPYLEKMLDNSPNKLNYYLNNFQFIHPRYYQLIRLIQSRFSTEIIKDSSSFDDILISIGQLEEIVFGFDTIKKYSLKEDSWEDKLARFIYQDRTLIEINQFIFDQKISLFKKFLEIESELDSSKLQPHVLRCILAARRSIKCRSLKDVFDLLIEFDLKTGCKSTDFTDAHDFNNLSAPGEFVKKISNLHGFHSLKENAAIKNSNLERQLSKHNLLIEFELYESGINTTLAFKYPQQKFSIKSDTMVDFSEFAASLNVDQENLENRLHTLRTSTHTHLSADMLEVNNVKFFRSHLPGPVEKQIEHLEQREIIFRDGLKAKLLAEKLQKAEKMEFIIQQADKNLCSNFQLQPNFSQTIFPIADNYSNLVLMCMDKAMMLHAIYDKATNEQVCQHFFFFAKDEKHPRDIYVVSSNFEFCADYAFNKALKCTLWTKLIDFTGQYAKAIGAKGLICKPSDWFVDCYQSFKEFTTVDIKIEKVGGFVALSENDTAEEARDRYSLSQVLNAQAFYLYEKSPVFQAEEEVKHEQLRPS